MGYTPLGDVHNSRLSNRGVGYSPIGASGHVTNKNITLRGFGSMVSRATLIAVAVARAASWWAW